MARWFLSLAFSFLLLGFFSLRGALGDSPPLLPEDSSPSRSACACAIAASMSSSSSSDEAFFPTGFGFSLPGALGDWSPLLLSLLLSPLLSGVVPRTLAGDEKFCSISLHQHGAPPRVPIPRRPRLAA